ncbi:hypothetical protein TRFO_19749 [Tritrichomonas foetus]|uniref:BEACH domain-containing protein n=1 Tax=Tritrichomonas foetus TaxID=1144522 RepID=A0A1J4KMD2_9EUKA|nr:hypothetical protein TRFO_19749 [Tritrichomonas foetus]|eukprot:OHT10854.1 hypothetical protein TRFO_19749 [Tritrichomonas foetus]
MNSNDLLSSIADTVIIIMKEINGKDQETQRHLLIQVIPFFKEILSNISKVSKISKVVTNATSQFLLSIADSLTALLKSNEDSKILSQFLVDFVSSQLALECSNDVTRLITSLISIQDDSENSLIFFIPFIEEYFKIKSYRSIFINSCGLETAWCSFFVDKSNILIPLIFQQFSLYLFDFLDKKYRSQINGFLNTISSSIMELNPKKSIQIFNILFLILQHDSKEFSKIYEKTGLFDSLKQFIFSEGENIKFLNFFIKFAQTMPFEENGKLNTPLQIIINTIGSSQCSKTIRQQCINFFLSVVAHDNPLKADKISQIAVSIPYDDEVSIILFSELCYILQTASNFDLMPIIPTLLRFCNFDLMISFDLSKFLTIFINIGVDFAPYVPAFLIPLFNPLSAEKIALLFDKYNDLYTLFELFFGEHLKENEMISLLKSFLKAFPYLHNNEPAKVAILNVINSKKGYKYVNEILIAIEESIEQIESANVLFSILIKCALSNKAFSQECIQQRSYEKAIYFYSFYQFSSSQILNFISAISTHKYIMELDSQVFYLLENTNYLEESPDNLLYLALGLQIGEGKANATLCFPSILHRCSPYIFTSYFDLWLCGQISLDIWVNLSKKDISSFPSIIGTARQFIFPHHARLVYENSYLLEKVMSGEFQKVPLFEFPSLKTDISLDIPCIENSKSFSFWFHLKSFTTVSSPIFSLKSISFSIREENIFVDGNNVGKILLNTWHFIVVSYENNCEYSIYLDCNLIYSCKSKYTSSVSFGSKYSVSNFCIGGAIRIFKYPLTKLQIPYLFNSGVEFLETTEFNELLTYSPYEIIPLFSQFDQTKAQSSRPITIYSVLDYYKNVHHDATNLFTRAIKNIHQKNINEAAALANTICYLHKHHVSFLNNHQFASFMSIICNFETELVTPKIIDNICSCFVNENNESFDWNAYFTFSLDYSFFLSQFGLCIISSLFQYNVRFPIPQESPLNSVLTDFLLSLLLLPELKKEYLDTLLDLISIHTKNPSQIIRTIVSYPNFGDDLQDYSGKIDIKAINIKSKTYSNEIINSLVNILLNLPANNFTEYYFLRLVNPKQAFKLIENIMRDDFSAMDEKAILRYCFDNLNYLQAWEIAVSIFLQKPTRLDGLEFDGSSFNMKHYVTCVKFLTSLVYVAARTNSSNFWNQLCCKLLNILINLVDKQGNFHRRLQNYILMMMSFGMPYRTKCLFPPGPSITSANDIIMYSMSRGQVFPDKDPEPYKLPTFEFKIRNNDIKDLSIYTPNTVYLSSTFEIQMNLKLKELSYVITEKQTETDNFDWDEYLSKLYNAFGIDNPEIFDVENSNISIYVSRFIIAEMQHYNQLIEPVLSTHIYFPHKLSTYWMQHLSIETLQMCDSKDIYIPSFISYICQRLIEGWFSTLFLVILSYIFSILKKKEKTFKQYSSVTSFPKSFYMCILFSMDLVHSNQISMLGDLFVDNESVILLPEFYENLSYVIIFISRGISLVPFLNRNFANFWLRFLSLIENSEKINQNWKKKYPEVDFITVIEGLKILGKDGIVEYTNLKNNDLDFWENFDDFIQFHFQRKLTKMKSNAANDLNKLVEVREEASVQFLDDIQRILTSNSSHLTISKAIASSLRYFTRRSLLTRCEYYIRLREKTVSYVIPFTESKSTRYALSILSDPIFPTRRKTLSPLEYDTPSYPSGTSDEIFHYIPKNKYDFGTFPDCILQCFTSCRFRVPSLLRRSPFSIHARFTGSLPISPSVEYQMFLEISNRGKPFDFSCDASLLFGVDVLEGSVFFGKKRLFFLDGLKIRNNNQLYHIHQDDNPISHEFYIQCFQSGLFSNNSFTYRGHFCLITELNQIITATNHLWIQRPYSVTLNYSSGYNFILNFSRSTYDEAYHYIYKGMSRFYDISPPETNYLSPINIGRLLYRETNLKNITKMWSSGFIDNFTYLSIVNRLGKRCFCDLTQYPVFPWVISDYYSPQLFDDMPIESYRDLKKPMGQLGEERARKFDMIFEDSYPQYYYGTHYLHFGVVTYFMFRIDPFSVFSFILHRGWDHPNRIFSRVTETWLSASAKSQSDVKELVPQMYKVPDYLTNNLDLSLFVEHDNLDVGTVVLPKWAKNPRHFILQNCRFFESEHVSQNIHHWIDLIFGVNSRGQGALNTKNLFHPTCYPESSEFMDENIDQVEKQAFITSIINFGQISPQIFRKQHIKRGTFEQSHLLTWIGNLVFQKLNCEFITFPVRDLYVASNNIIFASLPVTSKNSILINESNDDFSGELWTESSTDLIMNLSSLNTINNSSTNSIAESLSLSSMSNFSSSLIFNLNTVSPNNKRQINNISAVLPSHQTFFANEKTISCISISNDGFLACKGYIDGHFEISRLLYTNGRYSHESNISRFVTDFNIQTCAASTEHFLALAGCEDTVLQFDLGMKKELPSVDMKFTVEHIAIDDHAAVYWVAGGTSICLCSISGEILIEDNFSSEISSLCASNLPEYIENRFAVAGHVDGTVTFFGFSYRDMAIVVLQRAQLSENPITLIKIDARSQRVIAVSNKALFDFEYIGTQAKSLDPKFALECANCRAPMKGGLACSKCNRFLCSKCIKGETINGLKLQHLCSLCRSQFM